MFSPTINNIMTRLTALFLDYLPTSIESLSPRHWCFHHIVALIARRLYVFQWKHRAIPTHFSHIISAKASLQIFHHMSSMLCGCRPLAFMAYSTAHLLKIVRLDIWMCSIGWWNVRHFWVVDTHVTSHAAIRNPKLSIPRLLNLQRFSKQLLLESLEISLCLLESRITLEISLCELRRPQTIILALVLLPLWSVLCSHGPHE